MRLLQRQLLALLIILFSLSVYGTGMATTTSQSSTDEQLQLANKALAGGKYDEAITRYRAIIFTNGFSPELLHNLGNSYAGQNRNGTAILQYLRGLRLAPGNSDLQGSLDLARKNSGIYEEEDRGLMEIFFSRFDMNEWALGALIGLIGLTALFLFNALSLVKKGVYSLSLIFSLFLTLCLFGTFKQYRTWNGAVVTEPGTRLLISPFETALSQGTLDEGSLVFTQKEHGKYHYVGDEKGRYGWVKSTSFENIATSHLTYSPDSAGQ